MDLIHYKTEIPSDFSDNSRVWIYQSNHSFRPEEVLEIKMLLKNFVLEWKSHSALVKGYANLFFERFVILIADESDTNVSGCSTDSSVRVIKAIENKFNVQLFERQLLSFYIDSNIELIPFSQLNIAVQNGKIESNTLYFNNTITTKAELLKSWITPANQSWLSAKCLFADKVI